MNNNRFVTAQVKRLEVTKKQLILKRDRVQKQIEDFVQSKLPLLTELKSQIAAIDNTIATFTVSVIENEGLPPVPEVINVDTPAIPVEAEFRPAPLRALSPETIIEEVPSVVPPVEKFTPEASEEDDTPWNITPPSV